MQQLYGNKGLPYIIRLKQTTNQSWTRKFEAAN
jgi:hypothetical protein